MDDASVASNVNPVDDSRGDNATDPGEHEHETQVTAPSTTPTPTKQQKLNVVQAEPRPIADNNGPIESVREVNDHLLSPDEAEGIGGSSVLGRMGRHISRFNGVVVTLLGNI